MVEIHKILFVVCSHAYADADQFEIGRQLEMARSYPKLNLDSDHDLLVRLLVEFGFKAIDSLDSCRSHFGSISAEYITPESVARCIGLLANIVPIEDLSREEIETIELDQSVRSTGYYMMWSRSDMKSTRTAMKDRDRQRMENCVTAVCEKCPTLSWREVVYEMDHEGFYIADRAGNVLLKQYVLLRCTKFSRTKLLSARSTLVVDVRIVARLIRSGFPMVFFSSFIRQSSGRIFAIDFRPFFCIELFLTGLQLVIIGLMRGLHSTSFPIELLYRHWTNSDAQLTWFTQSLKNADVFCCADFPCDRADMQVLKTIPEEYRLKDVQVWLCLDLVETLLYLADSGFSQEVLSLMEMPLLRCPDVLLITLLQLSPSVTIVSSKTRQHLVRLCVQKFLPAHPNSQVSCTFSTHAECRTRRRDLFWYQKA